MEEARQRAQQQERVVNLLRRQRNFGVIVVILGVIGFIALVGLGYMINEKRKLWKQTARQLDQERQTLIEKSKILKESAKAALTNRTDDPIKDVTALRNLALALNLNREDIELASMARNLLLGGAWCPPAASEVRYRRDVLLAAAFAPGGNNNEVFAVAGDGQLLFWNGRKLSSVESLFEKPIPKDREIIQPGFASFSSDGQWLFVIPPTRAAAASTEFTAPGPPQQTPAALSRAGSSGDETCKLQVWRWSLREGKYQRAGDELEFHRFPGSRIINFAWSPESDRAVLINTRLNESKCTFFEVKGNTLEPLPEQSNKLNTMKVVALAFAQYRTGIAIISVDPVKPALRKVSLIDANDFEVLPETLSVRLPEDFQPNGIAFGPSDNELTLTSWGGIRTLNLPTGRLTPVPPPTFRDQFMRIVVGPGDYARRLVAKSLYGRVEVTKGTQMNEPAEPAVFGGSTGIAQFSSDGKRLLILSGGIWNVFDRMRLIDVSPLYRTQEAAPKTFDDKPAPPWLADIASAVSASDPGQDGSLMTLEDVRKKYPDSKSGNAYEAVWKRFFPDESATLKR